MEKMTEANLKKKKKKRQLEENEILEERGPGSSDT